jgi:hypothetical protein
VLVCVIIWKSQIIESALGWEIRKLVENLGRVESISLINMINNSGGLESQKITLTNLAIIVRDYQFR